MIVLYSSLEAASRDFIAEVPDDVTKIDWYADDISAYPGTSPSRFPSVYMLVNRNPATTATPFPGITVDIPQLPENSYGLLIEPASWQDVLDVAAANPNQDSLTSFSVGESQ